MLFGTLVHQTIEDIHKTVLKGEGTRLHRSRSKSGSTSTTCCCPKKERVYLAPSSQKAALNHVMRYYERENKNWDRMKEAEVEISLVKDDYILKGNVDLIRGEGDTVEIIDFKSEKKLDMEEIKEKLKQYQKQLEVYAHLVEERTGQKVSRMHLYYTGEESGNPYVSFTKDDRSIGKTIARFDEVVARIEAHDYQIQERPARLCTDCDMRAYCGEQELEVQRGWMRGLKGHIVKLASTEALRHAAEEFEIAVVDRRKRSDLEHAIATARRCGPEDLLGRLTEQQVKEVCEAVGVNSGGARTRWSNAWSACHHRKARRHPDERPRSRSPVPSLPDQAQEIHPP